MTREKTRISRNRDPYPLEGHAEPGKASISAARPWRRAERTRSERGYGSDKREIPRISVIIPVYNTGRAAAKLIEKLSKDRYKDLEIIAVDDGSTDDSYAKVKNLKIKNLKVFHKENGGASSARNLGLAHATGEYISFLDSDDDISPKFYTALSTALSAPGVILSVCGFRYNRLKQGTTKNAYVHMLEPRKDDETFDTYILRLLASDGRMYSSVNKLYRADLIKKNNLKFDETLNFAEDTKFVLDYLSAAKQAARAANYPKTPSPLDITFVLEPLYIYNYGTDTSTVASSALDWQNWQTSYKNLESWLGPHPDVAERRQLARVHNRWRISHALAVARSGLSFSEKSKYLNPILLPLFTLVAKIRK